MSRQNGEIRPNMNSPYHTKQSGEIYTIENMLRFFINLLF